MSRHLRDPYLKQAQKHGYRSRSAYKLIRPGMRIMDPGSAPAESGRWDCGADNDAHCQIGLAVSEGPQLRRWQRISGYRDESYPGRANLAIGG